MNKRLIIRHLAVTAIALSSCSNEIAIESDSTSGDSRIAIECQVGAEGAKSGYEGENQNSPVASVHFMAYTSGKLDAEYYGSGNKAVLKLIEGQEYNIYALTNTAAQEFETPEREDLLVERTISTAIDRLSARGGIPMSGNAKATVRKDATIRISCHRLFARYRISLTGDGAEYFEASEIHMTGVPESIKPFGYNCASSITDGDKATTRDLLDFNAGREIIFHLPENMQEDNRSALCTGVHISGRIHGYDGGGNAVFGFDRKISYNYLLKDDNGGFNINGNRDYISALQLNRYGWTLSDEQATLEEGSESMHYLFFCDSAGKPINSSYIRSEASNRTVRIYYRTDCDNVVITTDKNPAGENLTLLNRAIHCDKDIYCNEYRNSYQERQHDSQICFSAAYAGEGFELHAAADYIFESRKSDFSIVCDKDPEDMYIAQIAELTVNGSEDIQWQWTVDRPETAVLVSNGNSCRLECHGAGQVMITAHNAYGQTLTRQITIWKPAVVFTRNSVSLPLCGTGINIPFRYADRHGNTLNDSTFDSRLKNMLLIPQFAINHAVSGKPFVKCEGKQLYVSTLRSSGTSIMTLNAGDGSAYLGSLIHPENSTLANAGSYGLDGESLNAYTIVPNDDFDREFEMYNYYHTGGAVSNCCPEELYIPNATDFGIEISSELEAEVEVDGDYVWISWPMDRNLSGRYEMELYCRNDRDGSWLHLCTVGIEAFMYLGIKMISIYKDGLWWLVPVSYDNSSALFPKNREYVSWNRDSEYIDNIEIITSERKWGLHRNQIDGALCISRCEEYFGVISPALADGKTIDCSQYRFVNDEESRPLSEAFEINVNAANNPYIRIIDMSR